MATCALVVGHSETSPGAVNDAAGLSEFEFNNSLAKQIKVLSDEVEIELVYRKTYRNLPGEINQLNPDFIISMHCNAFNSQASGSEVLYYHRSKKGKAMAEILLAQFVDTLQLPNRGVRAKTSEDRGGFLLRYTHQPCIIAEPFFIDNNTDLETARQHFNPLCFAYINAINQIARETQEIIPA